MDIGLIKLAFSILRSFYVGDAAGRPNDHSDADIKFAQVLKLFLRFLYY